MEKEELTKKSKDIYEIKIIIVGKTGVGKTQILYRYTRQQFNSTFFATIGTDFESYTVDLDDKIFKLLFLDTAGQEKFTSITRGYFKNVALAIIVYDITDPDSFKTLEQWYQDCQSYGPKNINMVLVGNKNDLEEKRKISINEGMDFAEKYNIVFFETSAKDGTNIDNVFKEICKIINKNIDEGLYDYNDDSCGVKKLESSEGLEIKKTFCKSELIDDEDKKNKKKCC